MNVLLLSQFFSTTRGGGEYVFNMIARMLVENDHKVWVITNKIQDETYDKDIDIVFVKPTIRYQGGLPPTFKDNIQYAVNAIIAGSKIMRENRIDIIHSNNFSPALAGSVLSGLFSVPHVMTVHDVFSLCGKNYWKRWGEQADVSRLNVMLAPMFEKLMIKLRHDCIHTVSEASRDDLVKFGEKKPIHVIYNSIDVRPIVSSISINPLQFVYVGRLVFYKNLEVVIQSISLVKKTQPNVKLVIVGDGPHKKSLEELVVRLGVESNVEFLGYVTAAKKMEIISSSNALVFPSLCEGFGLVILEAFSQKRPVLVSNVRPMSDIVQNGKTGLVIDPHDEKKWAECMIQLIKNPGQSSEMGIQANYTLDLFGKNAMYENIVKMYSGLG